MKRIISLVAIVLLMGAGCATSSTTTTTVPPSTQSPGVSIDATGNVGVTIDTTPSAATVTFDGSSFAPATVTIANGGTVTWKNASGNNLWVASNPHPTHTDYPGFDAKAAIHAGQEWSFTFTKSGSWGYHDHLNPSIGGTVIVK